MGYKGLVVVAGSTPPLEACASYATHRIANRPIACHAVESLALAGIGDVAVVGVSGALDEVRQCIAGELSPGIDITYLPQEGRADLLGALQAAEDFVDDQPVVVHLADGLLGQRLDGLVQEHDLIEMPDMLLLLHRGEASRPGLEPVTQRLLGLAELNGHSARLAVAGVCAFGPAALTKAARAPHAVDCVDLITIAEQLASGGRNLEAEVVRSWRRYRGDPVDLLELNRIVLDQQVLQNEIIDRGDNRIEGRAVIHPTAEVHSSIILGPCIIGAHSRVSNSYIGPYTSVGARAEIEGTEIVHSIIAEDVHIRHVGGRIEGSTIGSRANIFRDFALPRAMRLHVGEDVEVALN
jgi:glucose-1-phosphate thymidylyltransferase